MRKHDRRWHQLGSLVAGVTKHNPLIARPLLGRLLPLGFLRIDALGDVLRLLRQIVIDENLIGMKHVILVHIANIPNGGAHDRLVIELRFRRDLPSENDHVGFNHGFASDAAGAILRKAGVEHAVGDQVSDFVRMSFTHGLGGENE